MPSILDEYIETGVLRLPKMTRGAVRALVAAEQAKRAAQIEVVRVGEDPFGRDEPTVYYRDHSTPDSGVLYMWVQLWPADWPALPQTNELTPVPDAAARG